MPVDTKMSYSNPVPTESLHHAYRFEQLRVFWLTAAGRTDEAEIAECNRLKYKSRLWADLGIEV